MRMFYVGNRVLWHDPWRTDWGVPEDTRVWDIYDLAEDMAYISTGELGSDDYAEAEVPLQELELLWAARLKSIIIKVVIIVARVIWAIGYFAVILYAMYVVAVVLDECIPSGTNDWVRLAIGTSCLLVATTCVGILYIEMSRFLDSFTNYRVLELRPWNRRNPSKILKRKLYYRLAQMRRWTRTERGERAIVRFWTAMCVIAAVCILLLVIGSI